MNDKIISCNVPLSTIVRALEGLRYGVELLSRLKHYEDEERSRWDIESVPFSVTSSAEEPLWVAEAEEYEENQRDCLFLSIIDLEHYLWSCSVRSDRDV